MIGKKSGNDGRQPRILIYCDARIPTPPLDYGGTERIAGSLCQTLADRGYVVDLIAAKGSRQYSGSLTTHQPATMSRWDRIYRKVRFQLTLLTAIRKADVTIGFGRPDYLWSSARLRHPTVIVFQNPVTQIELDRLSAFDRSTTRIVMISHDQARDLTVPHPMSIVHNATNLTSIYQADRSVRRDYLLFLGRLTPNKGTHLAIEAAKRTNSKLIIAGNIAVEEAGAQQFFNEQIKPNLSESIQWVGPVNDERKIQLFQGARALLFPIQWREPFGIVMPESLACECPVIAWRNGSVSEVVEDGKTGFVVQSMDEMVSAIRKLDDIEPAVCRRVALEKFSAESMTNNYIRVVDDLLERPHNRHKHTH